MLRGTEVSPTDDPCTSNYQPQDGENLRRLFSLYCSHCIKISSSLVFNKNQPCREFNSQWSTILTEVYLISFFLYFFPFVYFPEKNQVLFPETQKLWGGLEFSVTSTSEITPSNEKIMKLKSSMEKTAYEITIWVSKLEVKKDIHFSDSAPLHAQELPVKRPISYKTEEVLASFPVKVTELFLMKSSYLLISRNLSHNSNWSLTDLSAKSLHWLRFYAEPFRRDS